MYKFILTLALAICFLSVGHTQNPPSSFNVEAKVTGSPSQKDRRAMVRMVQMENERRAADLDEEGNPVSLPLPTSTNVELKNSYETVLTKIIQSAHDSYIDQADVAQLSDIRPLLKQATDEQLNQILLILAP